MLSRKAQVTLFVIIAILIVAAVGTVVYLQVKPTLLPPKLAAVEDYFLLCVANILNDGSAILGEQAGWIDPPELEPGSDFAPFSSRFDLLGLSIPYWFYLSSNGLYKEQVPSIEGMEAQLAAYVEERLAECDFSGFAEQGYEISLESPEEAEATATITLSHVGVDIDYPITISFGELRRRVATHKTRIASSLGRLYSVAKSIYDTEQSSLFLENYAFDILTLYAPTTDVVLSCAPLTWSKTALGAQIRGALQVNMPSIKFKGDYYELTKEENIYFVQDLGIKLKDQVNVLYSATWPTKLETWPSENGLLRADPIGPQEGLGILGFCYVPYHFVYSLTYPVLIQVYDESYNLFQFPLVVAIDKNKPRQAEVIETPPAAIAELCEHPLEEVGVTTRNTNLEPLSAAISFKCHGTVCPIGSTSRDRFGDTSLTAPFPQCVNGFVIAKAEGYATTTQQLSTNQPAIIDLILQPLYKLDLSVLKDATQLINETVLISFRSDGYSTSVLYPTQRSVELVEGVYNVSAQLFALGELTLEGESIEQCIKVPAGGIAGVLGFTSEECYDVEIPEQVVTQVVAGGGSAEWPVSESELRGATTLTVGVTAHPVPTTITELQDVFGLVAEDKLRIGLS